MSVEAPTRTNLDPTHSPDDGNLGFDDPAFDDAEDFAGGRPKGLTPPETDPHMGFDGPDPAEAAAAAPEAEPVPTATERLNSVLDFSGNAGVPTWQQVGEFAALKTEIDTTDPDHPVHKTTGEPVDAKKLADGELLLDAEKRILSRETTEQRVQDSRAPKNPGEMSTEQKRRFEAYQAAQGTDSGFAKLPERAQVLQWKAANGAEAALSRGLLRLKREERARQRAEADAQRAAASAAKPTPAETGKASDPAEGAKKPEASADTSGSDAEDAEDDGGKFARPRKPASATETETETVAAPMPRAPRSDFKTKVPMPKLGKNGRPKYQKPTMRTREEIQSLMAPRLENRGDVAAQYQREYAIAQEELAGMKKGTAEYYMANQQVRQSMKARLEELKKTDAFKVEGGPTEPDATTDIDDVPDWLLTPEELGRKYARTESPRRRLFKDGETLTDMFEGGEEGDEYKRFADLFDDASETGGKSRESRGKVRARLRRFGGFVLRTTENVMGNASGLNAAEDIRADVKQARANRRAAKAARAAEAADPFAPAPEAKKQRVKKAARRAGRAVLKGLAATGAAQFGVPLPESSRSAASAETAPPRSTRSDAEFDAWKASRPIDSDVFFAPSSSPQEGSVDSTRLEVPGMVLNPWTGKYEPLKDPFADDEVAPAAQGEHPEHAAKFDEHFDDDGLDKKPAASVPSK